MKDLVGSIEPQPISGPVIDSVLDHRQLLIRYCHNAPLLGNVLAQQTVEVLVAAALPTAIKVIKAAFALDHPSPGSSLLRLILESAIVKINHLTKQELH